MAVSALCAAVVTTTAGPRRDLDYWWHVILGRAILSGQASGAAQWSVWPGDPGWRTAQPLAEVALAMADQWWQAAAPGTVRATTAAAAMATLTAATRPWSWGSRSLSALRWWSFACGAVVVMGFTQERPAQVGLILMPLAGSLVAWWVGGATARRRRWILLGAITAAVGGAWALSHQSWLLAWCVLLAAVALSPRRAPITGAALGLLAAVMVWAWLWLGPPWRAVGVAGAAAALAEWQPTRFHTVPGAPAAAMVVAFAWVAASILRGPRGSRWHRGDAALYACMVLLGVAGASAWRHVPVTVLAAGPLLIALAQAHCIDAPEPPLPVVGQRGTLGRNRLPWPHRGTGRGAITAGRLLMVAVPLVASVVIIHVGALVRPAHATDADHIATLATRHACRLHGPGVIATHYNDSGPALAGARSAKCNHAAAMQVVIDGRADRYGADALRRWQAVMRLEGPGWRRDWDAAGASLALLRSGAPLGGELRRQGWLVAEIRHGYQVLYRPGATVAPP